MGIEFKDFDQWLWVKDRISGGFIPCPVCNQWTNDIRKIPDGLMRYISIFTIKEYACGNCIDTAVGNKTRDEIDAKTPKCNIISHKRNCTSGFVYFADCSSRDIFMVKIGTSKSSKGISSRLYDVRKSYGLVNPPNLLRVVETNCGVSLEKYIHDVLRNKRLYREMFELDDDVSRYIAGINDYVEVGKIRY